MQKAKRTLIASAAAAVAVSISLALAGCDGMSIDKPDDEPVTYSVTYASGDGTGAAPEGGSYEVGATVTLASASGLSYEGHVFDGWSDGSTKYNVGASYTMPDHDVTFTAQWKTDEVGATTYTVTYVLNGGTGTAPTQSALEAGATFEVASGAGLSKENHTFGGWNDGTQTYQAGATYTMPESNVTLTAQWTEIGGAAQTVRIVYVYNLGDEPHSGNIGSVSVQAGGTATVADGNDYEVERDYMFLGWTTDGSTPMQFSGGEHPGQYSAGDSITLGDGNIILYAQWAKAHTDMREASDDKIYVYDALIDRGLGAAILVRDGQPNKLGFVASAEETGTGYAEAQFMFDAEDGGDVIARITGDKYLRSDGMDGVYLLYDYVTDSNDAYFIATDGFGSAIINEMVGSMTKVYAYGLYEYDEQYGDYVFAYIDAETGEAMTDENGEPLMLYFALVKASVPGTQFDGYFIRQGWESGSYLLYGNGEISYAYRLDLNGYGSAEWYELDPDGGTSTLIAAGSYAGTDNYESYVGEWRFAPDAAGVSGFDFILNVVSGATGSVPVYIEHDEELECTFTEVGNAQNTLYLDGYGSARYSANSQTLVGYCTVNASKTLVTFVPYIDDGDSVTTGGKMYFDIDFAAKTFAVNADGYVVDNGVLVEYRGESSVIVIPSGVTEISERVFAFDSEAGFSVSYVTISADVERIGRCAFENNRTLHRVTFLSETPIDIDFAAANNPFRWPAGDFVIVVPEDSVQAYKTAWSDCPYAIKGSEEITRLPEFEVEDGVLVRYNKQPNAGNALDITIPNGVTSIAAGVFRGLEYIRSVDLNGVTEIGDGAFESCVNLISVTANNVRTVGAGAFYGCESLGSGMNGTLELPQAVEIGENAFQGCASLRLVRLGANIESIGTLAFSECNIYEHDPPIVVELMGSTLPQMAEKVFTGNIAFRIKVQSFETAKKFYDDIAYSSYCYSLYIESGDEQGMYMDGSYTLELDGRAILLSSSVMIYKIDGTTITLLEYDNERHSYTTVTGTIEGGVVSFVYGGVRLAFTKLDGNHRTYTSADGLYAFECDPLQLTPEYYGENSGTSTVTLNGAQAELYIIGFNSKTIRFTDTDGKKYDLTIDLGTGNTFTYTKALSNYYVRNITSDDGSSITLHFTASGIYVFGEIKAEIVAGSEATLLPAGSSDHSYLVTQVSANVFTFVRTYQNDRYLVTLTLSQDMTTFTYTHQIIQ